MEHFQRMTFFVLKLNFNIQILNIVFLNFEF